MLVLDLQSTIFFKKTHFSNKQPYWQFRFKGLSTQYMHPPEALTVLQKIVKFSYFLVDILKINSTSPFTLFSIIQIIKMFLNLLYTAYFWAVTFVLFVYPRMNIYI